MTGQGRHRPQSWRLCSSKRAMFVVSRLSAGMQGARRKSVLQQRDRRSVCRFTRAYTVFLFLMEARRARKRPGWSRGRGGACLCALAGRLRQSATPAGRAPSDESSMPEPPPVIGDPGHAEMTEGYEQVLVLHYTVRLASFETPEERGSSSISSVQSVCAWWDPRGFAGFPAVGWPVVGSPSWYTCKIGQGKLSSPRYAQIQISTD